MNKKSRNPVVPPLRGVTTGYPPPRLRRAHAEREEVSIALGYA
ncbi:MAG: hypothetical protein ACRD2J_09495 [Thermoanaerobaculia bacterium]